MKDPATGKGRVFRAHRFALQLVMGKELSPEEFVLHRCDNPLCVKATGDNSTHLRLGDHSVNMVERSARGRSNFQALHFRADKKKKARAASARALHDAVKVSSYNQELV